MTIDECLAEVDDDKRNELERLRRIIKQVAPAAEDCISYAISAFRMKKILVGFGATLKHCAFYLFSGSIVGAHMDELKRFDISKGTILFQPQNPTPEELFRKLVLACTVENAETVG